MISRKNLVQGKTKGKGGGYRGTKEDVPCPLTLLGSRTSFLGGGGALVHGKAAREKAEIKKESQRDGHRGRSNPVSGQNEELRFPALAQQRKD